MGFANGSVTVIRGDLINDRGAKQRTVFESDEPITGVVFREGVSTTLFLATTGRILTLTITGRGQGQPAKTLEDTGCGVGCMAVDKATGDVVVVRDDAIYFYGLNGRGPTYAYEGPKQMVSVFGDFIALVSPPKAVAPTRLSTTRRFGGTRADEIFNTSTFALLDTDLKYVAHTETMITPIEALFVEWGDLFLLTLSGKVSLVNRSKRCQCSLLSFFATMRSLYSRSSRFFTSAIFMLWPSISRKKLASTLPSGILSYANTATICIRRVTTIQQCSNILRRLIIQSHPK